MDWSTLVSGICALISAAAALSAARIAGVMSGSTKVSEFRQIWINDLRNDVAEYLSKAEELMRSWEQVNDSSGDSKIRLLPDHERLRSSTLSVFRRIQMRINPTEDNPHKQEDDLFLHNLNELINIGKLVPKNWRPDWDKRADEAVKEARHLLKREWEVAKKEAKSSKFLWLF